MPLTYFSWDTEKFTDWHASSKNWNTVKIQKIRTPETNAVINLKLELSF